MSLDLAAITLLTIILAFLCAQSVRDFFSAIGRKHFLLAFVLFISISLCALVFVVYVDILVDGGAR